MDSASWLRPVIQDDGLRQMNSRLGNLVLLHGFRDEFVCLLAILRVDFSLIWISKQFGLFEIVAPVGGRLSIDDGLILFFGVDRNANDKELAYEMPSTCLSI